MDICHWCGKKLKGDEETYCSEDCAEEGAQEYGRSLREYDEESARREIEDEYECRYLNSDYSF